MKSLEKIVVVVGVLACLAAPARAATLVDDTWADGTRTNTSYPTDAAWFTQFPLLSATGVGFMSFTNNNASSSQWTTYFADAGSPIHLNVGDALKIEWSFTIDFMGSVSATASRVFKVGIFDSSAGIRLTNDAGPNGAGLVGYSMIQSFPATWQANNSLQWLERAPAAIGNAGIMTATGDYLSLATGGTAAGSPAYAEGGSYTLSLTISNANSTNIVVTAAWSGGGLTNALTAISSTNRVVNFDTFIVRPSSGDLTAYTFTTTRFKVTGPVGLPSAPAVVLQPSSIARKEGTYAPFNVSASGGQPLKYQWYFNTNTPLSDQTNSLLALSNVQLTNAGKYSVIITNSQGSVTSSFATLTVSTSTYTPLGTIVDDVWADGSHNNTPIGVDSSLWFGSIAGIISSSAGSMILSPDAATSRSWVGYFTADPAVPVDLAVGRAIKATLVFNPSGVATQNTSSLRFGLFDYADGGARINAEPFGSISTNVTGYMLTENFGASFGDDTPMEIYARTSLGSGDLQGTTADYFSLGAGPVGSTNQPAFVDGTPYTLEFTVARTSETRADITTKITGGSLNISFTTNDTTYLYRRFDAFGIRANRTFDSANSFDITQFKVEVVTNSIIAATPGTPRITNVARVGSNLVINGTNGTQSGTYWVLTSTNITLARANWTSVATNQFDASGNFIFTNAITTPVRFINIRQLP